MINGYSPVVPKTYVEQVFNPLYPLDFGQLGPSEYEVLRKFNVRYIVMHEEAFPEKVSPFPAFRYHPEPDEFALPARGAAIREACSYSKSGRGSRRKNRRRLRVVLFQRFLKRNVYRAGREN